MFFLSDDINVLQVAYDDCKPLCEIFMIKLVHKMTCKEYIIQPEVILCDDDWLFRFYMPENFECGEYVLFVYCSDNEDNIYYKTTAFFECQCQS